MQYERRRNYRRLPCSYSFDSRRFLRRLGSQLRVPRSSFYLCSRCLRMNAGTSRSSSSNDPFTLLFTESSVVLSLCGAAGCVGVLGRNTGSSTATCCDADSDSLLTSAARSALGSIRGLGV